MLTLHSISEERINEDKLEKVPYVFSEEFKLKHDQFKPLSKEDLKVPSTPLITE